MKICIGYHLFFNKTYINTFNRRSSVQRSAAMLSKRGYIGASKIYYGLMILDDHNNPVTSNMELMWPHLTYEKKIDRKSKANKLRELRNIIKHRFGEYYVHGLMRRTG